jgi:hypothetical protein
MVSSHDSDEDSRLDDESLTSIHASEDSELSNSESFSFSSRRLKAPSEYSVDPSSVTLSDESSSSLRDPTSFRRADLVSTAVSPSELQNDDAMPDKIVGNPTERLRLLPPSDWDSGPVLFVNRFTISAILFMKGLKSIIDARREQIFDLLEEDLKE